MDRQEAKTDTVAKVESGGHRRTALILTGIGLAALVVFLALYFIGLEEPDAYQYAEVAQNLAKGRGLTTGANLPIELLTFNRPVHPYFRKDPLFPLLLGLSFYLFGVNDYVTLLPNVISFLLLIPLIYFWVLRLASRRLAILACLLWIFNMRSLTLAGDGFMEMTLTLFFMLYIFYVFQGQRSWHCLLAGAALGLAQVSRFNFIIFILPGIWILLRRPQPRWPKILLLFAGFLLVYLPAIIRQSLFVEAATAKLLPSVLLTYTSAYPEGFWGYFYSLKPLSVAPLDFVLNHPLEIWHKYLDLFSTQVTGILSHYSVFIIAAIGGLFIPAADKTQKEARIFFLLLFALQFFLLPLFRVMPRYYFYYVPLLTFYAAIFLDYIYSRITKKIPFKKVVAMILAFIMLAPLLLLVIACLGRNVVLFHNRLLCVSPQQNFYHRAAAEIKPFIGPQDLIVTDLTNFIAFLNESPCIGLPFNLQTLDEIGRRFPVKAVVLSNVWVHPLDCWQEVIKTRKLPGYKLVLEKEYRKTFTRKGVTGGDIVLLLFMKDAP